MSRKGYNICQYKEEATGIIHVRLDTLECDSIVEVYIIVFPGNRENMNERN